MREDPELELDNEAQFSQFEVKRFVAFEMTKSEVIALIVTVYIIHATCLRIGQIAHSDTGITLFPGPLPR